MRTIGTVIKNVIGQSRPLAWLRVDETVDPHS